MPQRNDLLGIIDRATPKATQTLALATVTTVSPFYVTFDEDAGTETTMTFPIVGTYTPVLGDRVLMAKVNGSWVVMDSIGGSRTVDSWHDMTLTSGWTAYGAGVYDSPQYMKDSDGFVHLRGFVKTPASAIAANTTIYTMPVGYRPKAHADFPISTLLTTAISCRVLSSGSVNVASNAGFTGTASTWISLDSICYSVN